MSRNNITPVMMLTPGQALGAYALRRFPCGVVFIISSIFSIFILGISIALNQYTFLIFGVPCFVFAILFFPIIGPLTRSVAKGQARAAAIRQTQIEQQQAALAAQQQQQAAYQQWQAQQYQAFLQWQRENGTTP